MLLATTHLLPYKPCHEGDPKHVNDHQSVGDDAGLTVLGDKFDERLWSDSSLDIDRPLIRIMGFVEGARSQVVGWKGA